VQRLGETYGVPVVEAADADAVLDWCSHRGLGLAVPVVGELLGADLLDGRRRARRAKVRANASRIAAAILVAALLLVLGLVATDSPGGRVLHGRTGEVHTR
jgi:hypothetical protein